jgi:hypothetical protein
MSSLPPPSFIDDGASFHARTRHALPPSHRITSNDSDTSAYTGSYIDDGADMLLPPHHVPGFGPLDPRFYKQRKRQENSNEAVWNEDIKKAIEGDMQRSLEMMRGVADVEVRKADRSEERGQGKKGQETDKDTVTVSLPPKWGTFIIKQDNGRVIVIDEFGEFDSGEVGDKEKGQIGGKWVKAPSTVDVLEAASARSSHRKKESGRHRTKHHKPTKTLTSIPEYEYEEGSQLSEGEVVMSPTEFFMTGGAEGWPSRPASVARRSRHTSPTSSKGPASPTRSPPGAWPSPPQSFTKSYTASSREPSIQGGEKISNRSHKTSPKELLIQWGEEKSHRSHRTPSTSWKQGGEGDHVSIMSRSSYRPATVEEVLESSSETLESSFEAVGDEGWGGSHKSSMKSSMKISGRGKGGDVGWDGSNKSHRSSRHGTQPVVAQDKWGGSNKSGRSSRHDTQPVVAEDEWTNSQASSEKRSERSFKSNSRKQASDAGWGGSNSSNKSSRHSTQPVVLKTSWTDSQASSTHHKPSIASQNWIEAVKPGSHRNQHHHTPSTHASEASWDGYERPKTLSEVSVVGTGSERSSRASSRSKARSSRHGDGEWMSSEWSQNADVGYKGVGWRGIGGRGKGYRNDENNEDDEDDEWDVVKVRVGWR